MIKSHVGHNLPNNTWWVRVYGWATEDGARMAQTRIAKVAEFGGKPVLYVSAGQLETHADPVPKESHALAGSYIPARKTPGGNFTTPLFDCPPERLAGLEAALRECADKLWVARCNSQDEHFRQVAEAACYMADAALATTGGRSHG